MSRKTYEIAFAINGKMANGFNGAFSSASSRMSQLRIDMQKLNAQYKKGELGAEQYRAQHQSLASQLNKTRIAQDLYNRSMQKQNEISRLMTKAAYGSVRNTLTIGAGAMAVGGGFVLGSSIKKAMDYEAQLSSIQALTGINNDELKKMDDLALKMGADTKYSALQAAQGIEELLKAGMSPATVQAGGLKSALDLATAGGLDLTESAVAISDALNGFSKDGMSAADAANILAGAANASSTDVHKMTEALSAVGPVANGIGVSFKQVNATIAAFSGHLLKGSDAGTSLKTFLANVQPQTKEARAMFAEFGLTAKDGTNIFFKTNGQLKDMADVAGILRDKFKNLNEQQRSDTFFKLFGSDSQRAALALFDEGADGIKKMYKQMADVTALEVARKKMDNAAGSIEQLKGALETLQIRALRPTLPLIKRLADETGNFVERVTPAITKGVQDGVDAAKSYLHTHFIDNPDFQKLDRNAKIDFIFADLGKSFDKWFEENGRGMLNMAATEITGSLATALGASSKELGEAALKVGTSIATGVVNGYKEFMAKHTVEAGIIAGLLTPGTPFVKGAVAIGTTATAVQNNVTKNLESNGIMRTPDEQKEAVGNARKWFDNNVMPVFGIHPHAKGGLFSRPHVGLVAEAGPEAIIPLNGSSRARALWQTAGEKLGMNNSGSVINNFTFAPVINGNAGSDLIPILEKQQKSFVDQLKDEQNQKARVSYYGG